MRQMKYRLINCSWDITARCNLNCRHCCEGGKEKTPDMTTEEALKVAEQIIELRPECVVFTGGEPFMRPDWHLLASKLTEKGIAVTAISNGTLIDEDTVRKMIHCGIRSIGISVDGTEKTHDHIRGNGCYKKAMEGIRILKSAGIYCTAITTVMKNNLEELMDIKEELNQAGADAWQIQIGIPIGNLSNHRDNVVEPGELEKILDFCCQAADGSLRIHMADCIGYYNKKENALRRLNCSEGIMPVWQGCQAGISQLTIRYDGNVLGASLCTDDMIEGNIRERNLKEIWEDENAFAWRRKFKPEMMEGFCHDCRYLSLCQGGCSAVKMFIGGSITAENQYCLYRNAVLGK